MSIGSERYLQGLCAECGMIREHGNNTLWCSFCTKKERRNHTALLAQ